MFDLPYILTHPLLRSIVTRHAELKEEAEALPQGSVEYTSLQKRISRLEQYRLPKPDERDAQQTQDIFDDRATRSVSAIVCEDVW